MLLSLNRAQNSKTNKKEKSEWILATFRMIKMMVKNLIFRSGRKVNSSRTMSDNPSLTWTKSKYKTWTTPNYRRKLTNNLWGLLLLKEMSRWVKSEKIMGGSFGLTKSNPTWRLINNRDYFRWIIHINSATTFLIWTWWPKVECKLTCNRKRQFLWIGAPPKTSSRTPMTTQNHRTTTLLMC